MVRQHGPRELDGVVHVHRDIRVHPKPSPPLGAPGRRRDGLLPTIRLVPDAVAAVRVHGSRIRSNHVKDPSRGVQLHRESRVLRIRALVVRPDERPARRAALQLDRPPVAAAAAGGYALGEHVLRQELLAPDVVRVVVPAAPAAASLRNAPRFVTPRPDLIRSLDSRLDLVGGGDDIRGRAGPQQRRHAAPTRLRGGERRSVLLVRVRVAPRRRSRARRAPNLRRLDHAELLLQAEHLLRRLPLRPRE